MTTMMTMLERKKFTPQDVLTLANRELLAEARKLLQYTPSVISEEEEHVKRRTTEENVAGALEKLEIEPLDVGKVEAYQRAMLKAAKSKQSSAFVRYMHKSGEMEWKKGQWVTGTLTIVGVLSIVASCLLLGCFHDPATYGAHYAPLVDNIVRMYWGFFLSAYVILQYARHKRGTEIAAEWRAIRLDDYIAPVPDFAIARAVAVKRELPEAAFYVEELRVNVTDLVTEECVRPAPEPFLVMKYKGVTLYLDVWEEPKFEGRRVA